MSSERGNPGAITKEMVERNVDQLGINDETLRKYPLVSQLFGYRNREIKNAVASKIIGASQLMGRECTQDEKDAFAYHVGKAKVTITYSSPIAVLSTAMLHRRTFDTYGFPFYKPNSSFDPNTFLKVFKGESARRMWQFTRFGAYYIMCSIAARVLLASYAMSVYATNAARDPRLGHYTEAIMQDSWPKNRQRTFSGRPPMPVRQPPVPQSSAQETGQETYSSFEGTSAASQFSRDSQQAAQASPSDWPGMRQPPPERVQDSVQQAQRDFEGASYGLDDAPPVAASQRPSNSQQPSQQMTAWDRIRNQSKPAGAGQQQGQTGTWARKRAAVQADEQSSRDAQDGTSYTYSSSDQEKNYAKAQAQKDFDDMLEKERKGQSEASRRW